MGETHGTRTGSGACPLTRPLARPLARPLQIDWKIVKDVPNSELCDVRLPNNFSRPVTNSCDEQELPETEGMEVLRRMHEYPLITNVLDDYEFYEERLRGNLNKLTIMSGKQRRVRAMRSIMEQRERQDGALGQQADGAGEAPEAPEAPDVDSAAA